MSADPTFQSDTPATPAPGFLPAGEDITTLDGASVAARFLQSVGLALRTGADSAVHVSDDNPVPTADAAVLGALATVITALANLQTELGQKLEPGGQVALDSASLAALETIQVGNFPADPPTQTKLEAVRALLAGTLAVSGPLTDAQLRASALPVESGTPDTVDHDTGTATITLAAGTKLFSVLVVPSSGGQVTVTIPGQGADTPPVDFPYAEDFGGQVFAGDLVIAGDVDYYRVTSNAP